MVLMCWFGVESSWTWKRNRSVGVTNLGADKFLDLQSETVIGVVGSWEVGRMSKEAGSHADECRAGRVSV